MNHDKVIPAIFAALERDPDVNLHHNPIQITYTDALCLEGVVENICVKRKALRIAIKVAGTESIVDRIRLARGEPRGDASLLHATLHALTQEPAFRGLPVRPDPAGFDASDAHIEIGVADNVVALRGVVGSLSHRRLAEVTAWWVPGVADVDNRLQVHPSEQETDDEISDIVCLVLEKDPTLDASSIQVHTRNREVTLRGIVHSDEVRHIATEACWYIPGIHDVHNHIQVRP